MLIRNRGACSPQPTASTNSKCSPALQPAALSSRSPALLQPEDLSRGTRVQSRPTVRGGLAAGGGVNQVGGGVCWCLCVFAVRVRARRLHVFHKGHCVVLSPVPEKGSVATHTQRAHTHTHTHTRRGMRRGMRRGGGIDAWRAATVRRRPTCTNTHACAALALHPQRATQY